MYDCIKGASVSSFSVLCIIIYCIYFRLQLFCKTKSNTKVSAWDYIVIVGAVKACVVLLIYSLISLIVILISTI